VWQDGDSTSAELAELAADESELMRRKTAREIGMVQFVAELEALEAKRLELEAREPVPGRYVPQATGQTYGDLAEQAADDAELRKLVKGRGKFWALRAGELPAVFDGMPPVVVAGGPGDQGTVYPYLAFADAGAVFPLRG
jgi:hypothetical protein